MELLPYWRCTCPVAQSPDFCLVIEEHSNLNTEDAAGLHVPQWESSTQEIRVHVLRGVRYTLSSHSSKSRICIKCAGPLDISTTDRYSVNVNCVSCRTSNVTAMSNMRIFPRLWLVLPRARPTCHEYHVSHRGLQYSNTVHMAHPGLKSEHNRAN